MKKALLIFLAILLPLQAFSAVERSFAHAIEGRSDDSVLLMHLAEHATSVLHHHDDGGTEHEDESPASAQHLLDYEQAFGTSFLLLTPVQVPQLPVAYAHPAFYADAIATRITAPPFRPPHLPA